MTGLWIFSTLPAKLWVIGLHWNTKAGLSSRLGHTWVEFRTKQHLSPVRPPNAGQLLQLLIQHVIRANSKQLTKLNKIPQNTPHTTSTRSRWRHIETLLPTYLKKMRFWLKIKPDSSNRKPSPNLIVLAGLWSTVPVAQCSLPFVHQGLKYCGCRRGVMFPNDTICQKNYYSCQLSDGNPAFCDG